MNIDGVVLDTSVVIAIIEGEPEATRFAIALENTRARVIAAPSVLEAMLVLSRRRGADSQSIIAAFLTGFDVSVVQFDLEMVKFAFSAFLAFGKGRHTAALNFGDCFSYALARSREMPLLFKGDDFAATDLAFASY